MTKTIVKQLLCICIPSLFLQHAFAQTPVVINLYNPYQTILSLGSHDPNGQQNMIIDDLGASSERVYIAWQFKPTAGAAYDFNAACANPSVSMINTLIGKGVKTFFSTSFTPPPYMKMNGLEADSTCYHDWTWTKPCTDPRNKLLPEWYDEYADYLVEYAKQFKTTFGIELAGLGMQNEPAFNEAYVSCVYTPGEMKKLVKLVGLRLVASGLKTRIICAEDMGSFPRNIGWLDSIVADPETRQYLGAWAVHGYTDGVSADMGSAGGWTSLYNYVNSYSLPLWMTETSGYLNTWDEGIKLGQAIHLGLRHGKLSVWSYCYSNNPGQPQFSLMTNSTPLASYYASKHYYKYIRPGAQQVESSCSDKDVLVTAFRHGDDKRLTLVIINNNVSSTKTILIQGDKLPTTFTMYTSSPSGNFVNQGSKTTTSFTVPAKSMNTLVYTGSNKQPTITRLDTMAFMMKKPGVPANYSINLAGITDGGGEGQALTVTSASVNPTWFSSLTTAYTSPQTTGKINFSPVDNQAGNTTFTVTVGDGSTADNGFYSNEKISFTVALLAFVNSAPTVDAIALWKVGKSLSSKQIPLTGITDGNDGSQKLSLTAVSSNNNIVTTVYISGYKAGGTTASIGFVPKAVGEANITLTITDDGNTFLSGVNQKKMVIKVQVLEFYNLGESFDPEISVFPNPAMDYVRISNPGMKYKRMTVSDMTGSVIYSNAINEEEKTLDVSAWNAGMYIIRLENEDKTTVRKVLIER